MSFTVLDGKAVSEAHLLRLKNRVESFCRQHQRPPGLGVVIVGNDPASHVYVKNKETACHKLGLYSLRTQLPEDCTNEDLLHAIEQMNANPHIDGFLVQFPLPSHLSQDAALQAIDPQKDADGLTYQNLGLLLGGNTRVAPCTPAGVMQILQHYNIPIAGKSAVVIGRSNIVGKPMSLLLSEANATVTICHSKTQNLYEHTQKADIVVVAVGRPQFIGKEAFHPNCTVIDVGIHRIKQADGSTRLCGDTRYPELQSHVRAATPVPGGVGVMTVTMLLDNTIKLAELRNN